MFRSSQPILLEIYASNVVTSNASEAVDQAAPQLQSATVGRIHPDAGLRRAAATKPPRRPGAHSP